MATCNSSSHEEEYEVMRKGPWTLEEDNLLIHHVSSWGEGRWNSLAKCAGLKRTGKSCRLRWLNYLKPDIKRGNLTPQEQLLILELHSKWGNRWSKIAQHLPGRTDNEIKNYWRTRVQKQARQLKVDANSKRFLEAIKCFWMPRLLEKVEQSGGGAAPLSTAASSSSSSISSTLENQNQDCTFSQLPANHAISTFPAEIEEHDMMSSARNENCCCPVDGTICSAECTISQQETIPSLAIQGCQDDDMLCLSSEYMMMVAENDCFNYEIAGTFWNTDELWHFRKAEEASNDSWPLRA